MDKKRSPSSATKDACKMVSRRSSRLQKISENSNNSKKDVNNLTPKEINSNKPVSKVESSKYPLETLENKALLENDTVLESLFVDSNLVTHNDLDSTTTVKEDFGKTASLSKASVRSYTNKKSFEIHHYNESFGLPDESIFGEAYSDFSNTSELDVINESASTVTLIQPELVNEPWLMSTLESDFFSYPSGKECDIRYKAKEIKYNFRNRSRGKKSFSFLPEINTSIPDLNVGSFSEKSDSNSIANSCSEKCVSVTSTIKIIEEKSQSSINITALKDNLRQVIENAISENSLLEGSIGDIDLNIKIVNKQSLQQSHSIVDPNQSSDESRIPVEKCMPSKKSTAKKVSKGNLKETHESNIHQEKQAGVKPATKLKKGNLVYVDLMSKKSLGPFNCSVSSNKSSEPEEINSESGEPDCDLGHFNQTASSVSQSRSFIENGRTTKPNTFDKEVATTLDQTDLISNDKHLEVRLERHPALTASDQSKKMYVSKPQNKLKAEPKMSLSNVKSTVILDQKSPKEKIQKTSDQIIDQDNLLTNLLHVGKKDYKRRLRSHSQCEVVENSDSQLEQNNKVRLRARSQEITSTSKQTKELRSHSQIDVGEKPDAQQEQPNKLRLRARSQEITSTSKQTKELRSHSQIDVGEKPDAQQEQPNKLRLRARSQEITSTSKQTKELRSHSQIDVGEKPDAQQEQPNKLRLRARSQEITSTSMQTKELRSHSQSDVVEKRDAQLKQHDKLRLKARSQEITSTSKQTKELRSHSQCDVVENSDAQLEKQHNKVRLRARSQEITFTSRQTKELRSHSQCEVVEKSDSQLEQGKKMRLRARSQEITSTSRQTKELRSHSQCEVVEKSDSQLEQDKKMRLRARSQEITSTCKQTKDFSVQKPSAKVQTKAKVETKTESKLVVERTPKDIKINDKPKGRKTDERITSTASGGRKNLHHRSSLLPVSKEKINVISDVNKERKLRSKSLGRKSDVILSKGLAVGGQNSPSTNLASSLYKTDKLYLEKLGDQHNQTPSAPAKEKLDTKHTTSDLSTASNNNNRNSEPNEKKRSRSSHNLKAVNTENNKNDKLKGDYKSVGSLPVEMELPVTNSKSRSKNASQTPTSARVLNLTLSSNSCKSTGEDAEVVLKIGKRKRRPSVRRSLRSNVTPKISDAQSPCKTSENLEKNEMITKSEFDSSMVNLSLIEQHVQYNSVNLEQQNAKAVTALAKGRRSVTSTDKRKTLLSSPGPKNATSTSQESPISFKSSLKSKTFSKPAFGKVTSQSNENKCEVMPGPIPSLSSNKEKASAILTPNKRKLRSSIIVKNLLEEEVDESKETKTVNELQKSSVKNLEVAVSTQHKSRAKKKNIFTKSSAKLATPSKKNKKKSRSSIVLRSQDDEFSNIHDKEPQNLEKPKVIETGTNKYLNMESLMETNVKSAKETAEELQEVLSKLIEDNNQENNFTEDIKSVQKTVQNLSEISDKPTEIEIQDCEGASEPKTVNELQKSPVKNSEVAVSTQQKSSTQIKDISTKASAKLATPDKKNKKKLRSSIVLRSQDDEFSNIHGKEPQNLEKPSVIETVTNKYLNMESLMETNVKLAKETAEELQEVLSKLIEDNNQENNFTEDIKPVQKTVQNLSEIADKPTEIEIQDCEGASETKPELDLKLTVVTAELSEVSDKAFENLISPSKIGEQSSEIGVFEISGKLTENIIEKSGSTCRTNTNLKSIEKTVEKLSEIDGQPFENIVNKLSDTGEDAKECENVSTTRLDHKIAEEPIQLCSKSSECKSQERAFAAAKTAEKLPEISDKIAHTVVHQLSELSGKSLECIAQQCVTISKYQRELKSTQIPTVEFSHISDKATECHDSEIHRTTRSSRELDSITYFQPSQKTVEETLVICSKLTEDQQNHNAFEGDNKSETKREKNSEKSSVINGKHNEIYQENPIINDCGGTSDSKDFKSPQEIFEKLPDTIGQRAEGKSDCGNHSDICQENPITNDSGGTSELKDFQSPQEILEKLPESIGQPTEGKSASGKPTEICHENAITNDCGGTSEIKDDKSRQEICGKLSETIGQHTEGKKQSDCGDTSELKDFKSPQEILEKLPDSIGGSTESKSFYGKHTDICKEDIKSPKEICEKLPEIIGQPTEGKTADICQENTITNDCASSSESKHFVSPQEFFKMLPETIDHSNEDKNQENCTMDKQIDLCLELQIPEEKSVFEEESALISNDSTDSNGLNKISNSHQVLPNKPSVLTVRNKRSKPDLPLKTKNIKSKRKLNALVSVNNLPKRSKKLNHRTGCVSSDTTPNNRKLNRSVSSKNTIPIRISKRRKKSMGDVDVGSTKVTNTTAETKHQETKDSKNLAESESATNDVVKIGSHFYRRKYNENGACIGLKRNNEAMSNIDIDSSGAKDNFETEREKAEDVIKIGSHFYQRQYDESHVCVGVTKTKTHTKLYKRLKKGVDITYRTNKFQLDAKDPSSEINSFSVTNDEKEKTVAKELHQDKNLNLAENTKNSSLDEFATISETQRNVLVQNCITSEVRVVITAIDADLIKKEIESDCEDSADDSLTNTELVSNDIKEEDIKLEVPVEIFGTSVRRNGRSLPSKATDIDKHLQKVKIRFRGRKSNVQPVVVAKSTPSSVIINEFQMPLIHTEDIKKEEKEISDFTAGSFVWAQLGKFPFWPAYVCREPGSKRYKKIIGLYGKVLYHVRFFGDKGRRAWVFRKNMILYCSKMDLELIANKLKLEASSANLIKPYIVQITFLKMWQNAVEELEAAKSKSYDEILKIFEVAYEESRKVKRKSVCLDLDSVKLVSQVTEENATEKSKSQNEAISQIDIESVSVKNDTVITPAVEPSSTEVSEVTSPPQKRLRRHTESSTFKKPSSDWQLEVSPPKVKPRKQPDEVSDAGSKASSDVTVISSSSYSLESQIDLFKRNNLFKGLSKDKVCQYCMDFGEIYRCKGCSNTYHFECSTLVTDLNRLKKKKDKNDVNLDRSEVSDKSEVLENISVSEHQSIDLGTAENETKITEDQVQIVTVASKSHEISTPTITIPNEYQQLPLGEQIDMKMKEVMSQFDSKTVYYVDSSSNESNSEEDSLAKQIKTAHPVAEDKVLPRPRAKSKSRQSLKCVTAECDSFDETPSTSTSSSPSLVCKFKEIQHVTADGIMFQNFQFTDKNEANFKCGFCSIRMDPYCFVCHLPVSRSGSDLRIKCSLYRCGKYYHKQCLKMWPQTQWSLIKSTKHRNSIEEIDSFVCPSHVCHTCASEDPRAAISRCPSDKMVKCLRCPASYHSTNYCIPAGTGIISSSQILCPRHRTRAVQPLNTNWCFICSEGGNLICCETCPTSVHPECQTVNLTDDDKFICEDCESGRFPLYDEVVWVKLGSYRWWPAIILFPNEVPENVRLVKHQHGDFTVRFFGTNDYYWVNKTRSFLFQEGDKGHPTERSKKKVYEIFGPAIEQAAMAHKMKKEFKKRVEAESIGNLKPPPYIKIKINKPVGNVRTMDLDLSNANACSCDASQPHPCGPDSDCINRLLMTECDPDVCPAGKRCRNQSFDKRDYAPMMAFKTQGRGWGLKSLAPIKKGQFVIEYVGEVIDSEEYQRRIQKMHEQKEENYYFLTIDKDRMIDAGPKGNLSRFMNHSCNPNCETQKWTVNGDTRVGLFAMFDIPVGKELTFNYNLECIGKEKKACRCGAPNCSGFIGVKAKQDNNESKRTKRPSKKKTPEKLTVAPCFICKKKTSDIMCNNKSCSKGYHLKCLRFDVPDASKFICPRHNCNICSNRTIRCCVKCTNSFCPAHAEGNVRHERLLGFLCVKHDPRLTTRKLPKPKRTSSPITGEHSVTSTTSEGDHRSKRKRENRKRRLLKKELLDGSDTVKTSSPDCRISSSSVLTDSENETSKKHCR